MNKTSQVAQLTQAYGETMDHQTDKPKKGKKEMNPGLLAAHAVRVAKLNGKTPLQVGIEKTKTALDWVYRWGWSSPSTLDMLGGSARRGLSARLVKNGLLRSTRTQCGGAVRGVPNFILTLTETGQAEVERFCENLLPYERDPYKAVHQQKLRHDHLAQMATARTVIEGKIAGFKTEKELAEESSKGVKQPDIVWLLGNILMGLEVELTGKFGRQLDQFVYGCIHALIGNASQRPRFHRIAIVTDSPAIKKRYEQAFAPGAKYQVWSKNSRGYWVSENQVRTVPDNIKGRIQCQLIED